MFDSDILSKFEPFKPRREKFKYINEGGDITWFHAFIGPAIDPFMDVIGDVICMNNVKVFLHLFGSEHPAIVGRLVRAMREEYKERRVVFSTHNPLVINEMEPEEVTIVRKSDLVSGEEFHLTPLWRTQFFYQRARVYSLGELWLSYCDGITDSLFYPDQCGKCRYLSKDKKCESPYDGVCFEEIEEKEKTNESEESEESKAGEVAQGKQV